MNKKNIALLAKLETTPKGVKKWDKSQIEFIKEMLSKPAKAPAVELNPPVLDDEGNVVELWCNKHEVYEPVEEFTYYEKTTRYHPACKVAVKHWNDLTKVIKKMEKENMDIINAGGDIQAHIIQIESLKTERAGVYTK